MNSRFKYGTRRRETPIGTTGKSGVFLPHQRFRRSSGVAQPPRMFQSDRPFCVLPSGICPVDRISEYTCTSEWICLDTDRKEIDHEPNDLGSAGSIADNWIFPLRDLRPRRNTISRITQAISSTACFTTRTTTSHSTIGLRWARAGRNRRERRTCVRPLTWPTRLSANPAGVMNFGSRSASTAAAIFGSINSDRG